MTTFFAIENIGFSFRSMGNVWIIQLQPSILFFDRWNFNYIDTFFVWNESCSKECGDWNILKGAYYTRCGDFLSEARKFNKYRVSSIFDFIQNNSINQV